MADIARKSPSRGQRVFEQTNPFVDLTLVFCVVPSLDILVQIMEFLPGGDLMSLLMKEDTFTEDATKQVIDFLVLL